MTYFDPEPFAYVVDEAEMGKKGEMIEWHYKEWSKGIEIKSLTSKFEKKSQNVLYFLETITSIFPTIFNIIIWFKQ